MDLIPSSCIMQSSNDVNISPPQMSCSFSGNSFLRFLSASWHIVNVPTELISKTASTPLAVGAGRINPNKTMNPGLVYDAGREDYINVLCALNYSHDRIKLIIRTVTKAEEGPAIYAANVTSMKGFEVKVVPDELVFKEKNEKLSIEGPSLMEETLVLVISFG
ncbi:hypothetical protein FNV43_RR20256 [Rhamnella rubrinervis]|uniref:Subtilisin-like protease fibronectin type-III domain-containing protein n=1 Tax=Rhamnella rubrinervis TaxID=2594499 RepID=A0A8K0GQA5_9ROSA|nr:hypothetical protein FNV43_RR20256 [Rhamnella rubrinervis]